MMAELSTVAEIENDKPRGFDPSRLREDFPILSRTVHGKRLVYLDSAATSQKPETVIRALDDYYRQTNANVHRGVHTLAEEATAAFENTRSKVAKFIGGVKTEEVIFTKGTTEAINLLACSWGSANLKAGDRIVLTEMEHHANLVPWLTLTQRTGAEITYIHVDDRGRLDLDSAERLINERTRLAAITHMSNVLGTINPVREIAALAHRQGALLLVDGAQGAPHLPLNVHDLEVDFYAFSAHKMLGPTGVGFLYGKQKLLEEMEPFNYGGEMILEVRFDGATWNELPWKFEAGTPNIAGAVAFSAALEYLQDLGMEAVREHEEEITGYALERLKDLKYIRIFGPEDVRDRGGTISFTMDGVHPHDLSTILDTQGVAVRAGHHCAEPLHRRLGIKASTRASFYIYNTHEDADALIGALDQARRYFHRV